MKINSKTLKSLLRFIILIAISVVNYVVIRYLLGYIFDLFGGEQNVGWRAILLVCVVLSVVAIITWIISLRIGIKGKSREAIAACSQITVTTTIMYGCSVLLESVTNSSADIDTTFKTLHWLSLCISLGIFNHLYVRLQQRSIEHDDNSLVVVAECSDMASAEAICNTLEANDIKAMIVEKGSPVYIKDSDAAVQIQVCRKDQQAAKSHIAK